MLPPSANVPPAKLNVPPLPTLNDPAHPAVQLPPPEKISVPAFAFTVPLLLNTTLTVLDTPPVICNVPALLNVLAVPPLKMIPFPLPFTIFQVAPDTLLITAPLCSSNVAPAVVLPNVVVPETFSVRVFSNACGEVKLIPPLALVAPAPLIVPLVHVSRPLTLTVEVPVNVPPDKVSADVLTAPPTLLKSAVPPLMVSAPALVNVPVKFAVPPLTVVPPGMLYVPVRFSVPPLKITAPAPLMLPPSANVPPAKLNVPPLPTLNDPAHPVVQLPPPEKISVPAFAFTVPLLLNATLTVLDTPPVICNVPALLNVLAVPPLKMIPFPLPFTIFQVAPDTLLITAPLCGSNVAPAVVLPNVVVPETFSVRVFSNACGEVKLIPPLALVAPAPLIVPLVHVSRPLTLTVEVPVNVPPDKVSADVLTAPPTLLKFAVPPLMVSAPALVNVPVKFAVPPLTVVPPGML